MDFRFSFGYGNDLMTGFCLYFKVVSCPLPYSDMPTMRVFLSAMYDVRIEPNIS